MQPSIYAISLDVQDTHGAVELSMKRFDTGRLLQITLTDGGKAYTLTPDCDVLFTAKKPDGTAVFDVCQVSNGKVLHTVSQQTTAAPGKVQCEIRIYNTNGALSLQPGAAPELPDEHLLLTAAAFTIAVADTVVNDGDLIASVGENTLAQKLSQVLAGEILAKKGFFDELYSNGDLYAEALFVKEIQCPRMPFWRDQGTERSPIVLQYLLEGVYYLSGKGKVCWNGETIDLPVGIYCIYGNQILCLPIAGTPVRYTLSDSDYTVENYI